MKTIGYHPIILILLLIFSLSVTGQTLSVKGRWNIKAGYSLYKTHNFGFYQLPELPGIPDDVVYLRRSNVRIELNYGILKWLEVGGYFGLMSYKVVPMKEVYKGNLDAEITAIVPTFGVNANIQILPFFVKNQKCKWDFYIPIRYGGFYLTKWGTEDYGIWTTELDTWDEVKGGIPKNHPYRSEYGAGLGGAVYIKNIVGFYVEVLGGQFSYCPEIVRSPYNIRVGLTAKF